MTFAQALLYFFREAVQNLLRSWKVSLLAIFTISVSLTLAGLFLLLAGNLRQVIEQWRGESKVVVYLENDASDEDRSRLREQLVAPPWCEAADLVGPEAASQRFREAFPSLGDLLEGWGDQPLPASLEATILWDRVTKNELTGWIDGLRGDPAVSMVDDDRDWLAQLEAAAIVLEALAWALGAILLVTAIFTISSVIRLTAYLYHDEIAVMRMVGATEFFIRGPFYVEGLLQGLTGGACAAGLLATGHRLAAGPAEDSILASLLLSKFLSPLQLVVLVMLGGLAGLIGAVASLRRESLGRTAEDPEWEEAD
ncbi:MAG: ABC transporter permease [Acidobacteriota bacterium]